MLNRILTTAGWLLIAMTPAFGRVLAETQESGGRIEGSVTLVDGSPVKAVTVRIVEMDSSTTTNDKGEFSFASVPAGTYELAFTRLGRSVTRPQVTVREGTTTIVDQSVDWLIAFAETINVYGISKQRELVMKAPAAVSRVSEKTIEREAAHGQLPKLVEFTPGAQITQSGLYDFNLNTRGFNSLATRRVSVLIDGRQFVRSNLAAPIWTDVSTTLDDLAEAEFVRGPSGALYGVNASSGVLSLTTRSPRDSQGGTVRFTAGEIDTINLDFRWAGALGKDWYMKAVGGVRNTGDFSVSRTSSVEYSVPCASRGQTNCIPLEPAPLQRENDDNIWFGSFRFDKYFGDALLTFEGGTAHVEGPVFSADPSRVQFLDQDIPWARIAFDSRHWTFLGYYNRSEGPLLNLGSGAVNPGAKQEQVRFEVQGNRSFGRDRVRLVGGAAYDDVSLPGRFVRDVDENRFAGFAQIDWRVNDRLSLVAAGRADGSSLYDTHFSPKLAAVLSFTPLHSLRLTYGLAFEEPTVAELLVFRDIAPPADLSSLQTQYCGPVQIDCGFGTSESPVPVRVLVVGNESLELQKTTTLEMGYRGVLGEKVLATADFHIGRNQDFVTNFLPQPGTGVGLLNENYGPWEPPAGLPESVRDEILSQEPTLSNGPDGSPILANLSYTNFGKVKTRGAEASVNYYPDRHWMLSFAYAWFDFELEDPTPGIEDLPSPNTPEHSLTMGVRYSADRWSARLAGRWVDAFPWSSGIFVGPVESYAVVDLRADYSLTEHWKLGLNVANLLDNVHYQKFGGDLLRRRALGSVTFGW